MAYGKALELKVFTEIPATPPSGSVLLYYGTDGTLLQKDAAGVEAPVAWEWVRPIILSQFNQYPALMFVSVATTATLAGATYNGTTPPHTITGAPLVVDGLTLDYFTRVLVKDQAGAGGDASNGIYEVDTPGTGSNGVWTRTQDNIMPGSRVTAYEGATSGKTFVQTNPAPYPNNTWVEEGVTLVNAKGDLVAGTADNKHARLPVGVNGQLLTADSAQSTGLGWVTPAYLPKIASIGTLSADRLKYAPNVFQYAHPSSNAVGTLVIETLIPFINIMWRLRISGFEYRIGESVLDISVGGYAKSDNTITNHSALNQGNTKLTQIRLYQHNTTGNVVIAIDSVSGDWDYTKFVIDGWFGYGVMPDANMTGWSATVTADLSAYTLMSTPTFDVVTRSSQNLSDLNSASTARTNLGLGTAAVAADGDYLKPTIVDAKGDIIAATAADAVARLPVGTNGQVLTADSTQGTGLGWATPSGGSSVSSYKTVVAATTANITLSAPQTIDGVAVIAGDRVLVKNQTLPAANGVYAVAAGAWTRVADADSSAEAAGAVVVVLSGTVNGGAQFGTSFKATDTLGTTTMLWYPTVRRDADDSISAVALNLTTDYVNTLPTTPATGGRLFTRHRARRLPAFVGPTGQDTQLQPFLGSNRVLTMAVANGAATQALDGGMTAANVAAPTAVSIATTNFYTSMVRHRYTSAATAGAGAGTRTNSLQFFMSSTANMGGITWVARLGLNTITATNRGFFGLSGTGTALAPAVNPTTFLNCFGFGFDSAHTTMRFIHNDGAGTATSIDLGADFPVQTAATYFYELRIFVPSGGGQQVHWCAIRLNDGIVVQGGPITTDLPALNTLMAAHLHHGNGTTAAAVTLDVQSIYIETDN